MNALAGNTTAEYAFAEHEHRELARGIDRIHEVAIGAGNVAGPELSVASLGILDWMETVVGPHAAWEDSWLYPRIDGHAGTPWATKLMTYEHLQIRGIARTIATDRAEYHHEPTYDLAMRLRGHLFALEALLRAHIEREELFLIPLLDGPVRSSP